jgi:predicted ATP-dependent serine protease
VAKTKTSYFCQSCGAQAAKWAGKCNSCGEWNTLVEEVVHKESKNDRLQLFSANKNENNRSNQSNFITGNWHCRISTHSSSWAGASSSFRRRSCSG